MKAIPDSDAGTREALIRAGLDLFGRHGFEASSIREIAQAAGVNSAGIAYHFGGKDGLRQACAEAIVATMKQRVFGAAAVMPPLDGLAPEAAVELLLAIVGRVTAFAAQAPESEIIARFVTREMMEPTSAFETLYEGLVDPVHGQLCRLWAIATGMVAEAQETKLAVFATIGQVIYFRLARPAVMRRMGWSVIDPAQSEAIADVIRANLRASIASMRENRS
ncbi:MAG: CerR family C-terminal domain-containing protein [Bosea sp.]|uniref:CerR family C-terminal domain-containing protein n=1 Tax=Bosea sp. (in: a-proteobacteria) TaxID=1871050 RepID=UPI001AC23E45|nr:CerR family C-terminal domain-containing protein [Bosea sp. (in: a-proteobacteria)]MBN9450971.1 CerR family C-terminal domain-containing protein [Bosea sp. (in: a-proteobacteria)]